MLNQAQWEIERAKLVAAQDGIQSAIDDIDASFAPAGTAWSRVGVANSPMFSNNDLTITASSPSGHILRSTVSLPPGRLYFEIPIITRGNSGYLGAGFIRDDQTLSGPPLSLAAVRDGEWLWRSDGYKAHGSANSLSMPTWGSGDVLRFFRDENGKGWGGLNNSWIGDPEAGTGEMFSDLSGNIGACLAFFGNAGGPVASGQFVSPQFTPPSGSILLGAP